MVNLKYDSWHKEVLSRFGQMLGQNMQDFHSQISKVTSLGEKKVSNDSKCDDMFQPPCV